MTIHRPAIMLLLAAAFAGSAPALPRFASRTGAKCQSCHVNPAGSAMRLPFGMQYGRERLPVPSWSKDYELEDFSNIITNVLGVGADFRTLFYSLQVPGAAARSGFYQMQGDLYLNFRIAKKVGFFLKKGLRNGFEAYGLLNILPASGHVKVGKFLPNYGTRIDDHTTYIRQVTGMSPEQGRVERTGLEAAVSPGAFTLTGGIYNAEEGDPPPTSSAKAFLGRLEGMFKLDSDLSLGLGGNVLTKKVGGVTSTFYGGMGSFSWGGLTLLGEADLVKNKSPLGVTVTELVTYVEADYVVTQGLDLKLGYDFRDYNIDYKTGTIARYSIGFEFFPLGGVELRPVYRIVKEDPKAGNKNELDLLLHLYL